MSEARYDLLFGGHCQVPEPRAGGAGMVEASVGADAFLRLLDHWAGLPADSRPRLRGLTVSRAQGSGRMLELLLDTGGGRPFVLLTADWARGRPAPGVSGVWPYAQWWEEELSAFENLEFSGGDGDAGVAWRRN